MTPKLIPLPPWLATPEGLLMASRRASSNTMLAAMASSRPAEGVPFSAGSSIRTGGIRTSSPPSRRRSARTLPPFTRTWPLRTIL